MKTCTRCHREFDAGGAHRVCSTCRNKNSCRCGATKKRDSSTCLECKPAQNLGNNYAWRGGRHLKKGYVMMKCSGHPRGGKGGYVFEHILVMEGVLGRYLEKDENVHHLNGVRADNSPGNLELWVKPQPSGIRASDAVAWAKEILKRYEDSPA
jgi:hypothetical protein